MDHRLPPDIATDLEEHLRVLHLERALAELKGLTEDPAYMADLLDEIAACQAAQVGAAVTMIATLRGELSGRPVG